MLAIPLGNHYCFTIQRKTLLITGNNDTHDRSFQKTISAPIHPPPETFSTLNHIAAISISTYFNPEKHSQTDPKSDPRLKYICPAARWSINPGDRYLVDRGVATIDDLGCSNGYLGY